MLLVGGVEIEWADVLNTKLTLAIRPSLATEVYLANSLRKALDAPFPFSFLRFCFSLSFFPLALAIWSNMG